MTEENIEPIKIITDARGEYIFIIENKRYIFQFPINNTLTENLGAIEILRLEMIKTIEKRAKEEKKEEINDKTQNTD